MNHALAHYNLPILRQVLCYLSSVTAGFLRQVIRLQANPLTPYKYPLSNIGIVVVCFTQSPEMIHKVRKFNAYLQAPLWAPVHMSALFVTVKITFGKAAPPAFWVPPMIGSPQGLGEGGEYPLRTPENWVLSVGDSPL